MKRYAIPYRLTLLMVQIVFGVAVGLAYRGSFVWGVTG